MLELNLPAYDCKIKKKEGRLYIWDLIRRKFIQLSPEEWVRQHFINFLITEHKIPILFFSLEHRQQYNSLDKRSDIIVWDKDLNPLLLIECKASHIEITQSTLMQLNSYNDGLKASYIGITNGMQHFFYKKEENQYLQIERLPTLWI